MADSNQNEPVQPESESDPRQRARRAFLWTGVTAASAIVAACKGKDVFITDIPGGGGNLPPSGGGVALNLSTETGLLNYIYALEQLEASFYLRAQQSLALAGFTAAEQVLMTDIRNHEVIQREFLKGFLGNNAIATLSVNVNAVDFNSRSAVLGAARTIEDAKIAGHNGVAKYFRDPRNALLSVKIAALESRHSAAVRDLLNPGSADFAADGIIDSMGLDRVSEPSATLSALGPFFAAAPIITLQPT